MIPYSLSQNMLLSLIFLCWFLHLGVFIRAEDDRAKKIQEEYWSSNPQFPTVPLDTPEPISKEAYVYMHCTRSTIDSSLQYFNALKLVVYKLKVINDNYDPNPRDIIVFVCSYTEQWLIDIIKSLGVIVVPVDPIIPTGELAWMVSYIDQFTKLQLWRLTKWERVLYMDLDTTMTKDVFQVWDEPGAQIKTHPKDPKNAEYYPFLFSAVEDLGARRLKCNDCYFNAGVFMIKPDLAYYKRLIEGMNKDDYNRGFMEQDYFNHVFNTFGPTPASRLPAAYNRFVEYKDENEPGIKIMHNKLWARDKYAKGYYEAWQDDYHHLFQNQALDIERVYTLDDVFLINSTKKEAYAFLLNINDIKGKDFFMIYPALKISIMQIQEYQKNSDIERDIIVLAIEDIPSWQIKELSALGVLLIRVKHEKKGKVSWSDDYLKTMLWKLLHWDRILYIDNDVFISSKDFLSIWNEESTQIHTKPKQDYKQPLHNVPGGNAKRFYPYLLSAALDSSGSHFNANMFMFKPSGAHYQYLMSLFNEYAYKKEGLLNFAYSQDSPISPSTLDQSYNSKSLNKDTKALNGKIWTRLDEKDSNPFVAKFWDSFNELTVGVDGKKVFAKFDLPANCSEGTSPTRCEICEVGYDFVDYSKASYMICPLGVPFGKTLDWLEFDDQCESVSKECISCIQDGKCSTCETGFFSSHHCVISPKVSNDIVGYCSPSTEGDASFSYIAKGSICAAKLTPVRIAKRVLICTIFLFIMVITLLFARFFVMKIVRRFRKKNYQKMDESISMSDREEIGTPSTSKHMRAEDNA